MTTASDIVEESKQPITEHKLEVYNTVDNILTSDGKYTSITFKDMATFPAVSCSCISSSKLCQKCTLNSFLNDMKKDEIVCIRGIVSYTIGDKSCKIQVAYLYEFITNYSKYISFVVQGNSVSLVCYKNYSHELSLTDINELKTNCDFEYDMSMTITVKFLIMQQFYSFDRFLCRLLEKIIVYYKNKNDDQKKLLELHLETTNRIIKKDKFVRITGIKKEISEDKNENSYYKEQFIKYKKDLQKSEEEKRILEKKVNDLNDQLAKLKESTHVKKSSRNIKYDKLTNLRKSKRLVHLNKPRKSIEVNKIDKYFIDSDSVSVSDNVIVSIIF